MNLGLSLSGGGVKGAAHIGVIKALEEENIKIDCIAGTSSGSIVASLYAMGFCADEIYTLLKKTEYIGGVEVMPIPRNASYSLEDREPVIDSQYIENFILSKSINIGVDFQNTPTVEQ